MSDSVFSIDNVIYTGVAGTGKTHQLLQIARAYTDVLPSMDTQTLLREMLVALSWREVLCLIFLDFKQQHKELLKVPELCAHPFFLAKAALNQRDKHLPNTVQAELQRHSCKDSTTVGYKNRAAQAYFDKDVSGAWYLLPESLPLLTELAAQLAEWQQTCDSAPQQKCRYSMVSFHQAYGYEEFVEGIRPVTAAQGGALSYQVQDGAFLQLCQRAANDPSSRYAMLIDEINRANVSRVFGELLSLIEPDKRLGQAQAMQVQLAYSGRHFGVPDNVDIYATMNTQDQSLAPLDTALRRRFRFVTCPPRPELLPSIDVAAADTNSTLQIDLGRLLAGLNQRIVHSLGAEAQLGHAFFWHVTSLFELQQALVQQVIPQLLQLAGTQMAVVQYIFKDSEQPRDEQFVVAPPMPADAMPAAAWDEDGMSGGSFAGGLGGFAPSVTLGLDCHPDLVAGVGAFAHPQVYWRLYADAS
ncbi:McrB family protein [Psychrobacter aestuarii]|uniref:ATPase dynein-related AAA domain-containing protein n=1 Tax=Psychrobacter aestuarii TaxID=556327 RepID=A0ABP3FB51_9GAMM|nr:AAA family ATPase [Psychrobacter aestuarii]